MAAMERPNKEEAQEEDGIDFFTRIFKPRQLLQSLPSVKHLARSSAQYAVQSSRVVT